MFKEKLAIIVPTKDRPNELRHFLQSLAKEEIRPIQMIIVDGGNEDLRNVLNTFTNLNIDYIKKMPPSLTVQRNIGIKKLKEQATLVAFFDDDIVLTKNSLKNMIKFWEDAPEDVGGTCFNNMSQPFKRAKFFEKLFMVNSELPGKILLSGFQSLPCAVDKTMQTDWLTGCAMVFRKKIFKEFMFDERFSGYARYEDVDFSYRVGRKYKIFVVADAKVEHFLKLERIEESFGLGKMEVINRLYFVKKNPNLSVPLCYWALLGYFLNNVIKGLLGFDKRYNLRARGNISGFVELFLRGPLDIPFKKRLRMRVGDIIYKKIVTKSNINKGFRVLAYHSVTDKLIKDDWKENTIPKDLFEKQMKYLADNGYNVISGKQGIKYLINYQKIPPRTTVITFDDGYRNNYINALPVLKKYNFCATIFLTINFLQDYSADSQYLNISEVEHIAKSGIIDFGCHSLTHKALSTLTANELDEEVVGSKRKLEYLTHSKIELFAYPFGHSKSYNKQVIDKVKSAGYIGSFTTIFGLNDFNKDSFLLRRNRISWIDELNEFEKHLNGSYDWCSLFEYIKFKRLY